MYKTLLRTPLSQALVLIWVFGLYRLASTVAISSPTGTWVFVALLAAFVSVLIAGRFRTLPLLPVSIVLGLAATLVACHRLGHGDLPTLGAMTGLYAFIVWRGVCHLLPHAGFGRSLAFAGFAGGYESEGGRVGVERYVRWPCFVLVLLGILAAVSSRVDGAGVPAVPWPSAVVTLLFFWLAGRRYNSTLHAYLFIATAVWGGLSTYAAFAFSNVPPGMPFDYQHLALSIAACSLVAVGTGMRLHAADEIHLYATPLLRASVVLAGIAAAVVAGWAVTGTLAAPAWSALCAVAIAGIALLAANRCFRNAPLTAFGTVLLLMAALWSYSGFVFGSLPFGLWPAGPASGGQWLWFALLVLGLASLAYRLSLNPEWSEAYARPVYSVAALAYIWILISTFVLFVREVPQLPWVLVILTLVLFPLLKPLSRAFAIRGSGVALVASFLAAAIIGFSALPVVGSLAALLWAGALWAAGNFLWPRFNAHFPGWAVAPDTWPWLGLGLAGLGLLGLATGPDVSLWLLILLAGVYMVLMLRNSTWFGFSWLAVLSIAAAVTAWSWADHGDGVRQRNIDDIGGIAFVHLVLANALFLAIPLWRRYGSAFAEYLGWKNIQFRMPLLITAFLLCVAWLCGLAIWDGSLITETEARPDGSGRAVVLASLLAFSFAHGYWRRRSLATAHLCIAAVFLGVVATWGWLQPFRLPMLLSLWSAGIAVCKLYIERREGSATSTFEGALGSWVAASVAVALTAVVAMPDVAVAERLAALAVLGTAACVVGWQRQSRTWLITGLLLVLVLLHGIWLLFYTSGRVEGLLPWFALQFAFVARTLGWGMRRLQHLSRTVTARNATRLALLEELLNRGRPWISGLALVEWLAHAYSVIGDLSAHSLETMLMFAAGLVAVAIMIDSLARRTRRHLTAPYIYGLALLIAAAAIYVRVNLLGLSPPGVWDTGAIVAAGYGLFLLQRDTTLKPVQHVMMIVPLLALVTVPFQLDSGQATFALMAIGALYLLIRHATGFRTPLYLGLAVLNASIYLWIPDWSQRYGLLQIYLIPAALTVLVLLHLHRRELKSQVLNGGRLAALSVLYAVASVDVFLHESIWVFVLALVLSIAGIVIGIGLRIRAFLYSGIAFLVINVLGQLIQLYPEQRLGRALILMALGAAITGAMIWFNLKREAILERIRIFRADLAQWQ